MRFVCLGSILALMLTSNTRAGDWPQWLGSNRDGSSTEKVAPWQGELKPVWKKPVGEGNSSPVVVGGIVYLHTKVKDKDVEKLQGFDAKTGEVKWEKTYEKTKFTPPYGEGPRATPCVHDGKVFSYGNTGTLACWKASDGESIWQVDLLKELKVPNLLFGISSSPIVVGDLVVVMVGKEAAVAAFNTSDGKLAWKAGTDPASYASPVLIDGKELLFLTGANLLSLSPKGEIRWSFPFKDPINESSTTPIKAGDFYLISSILGGTVAVKVADVDGKATAKEAWKNAKLNSYFSTPVTVGKDHVYLVTGANPLLEKPAIALRCVEIATGAEVWKKEKIGKYHAALLKLGDGKLLMHTDDGDLVLLAPDLKQYQELSRSKVCGETWAHPALADGYIYVRDGKELICVKVGE